MTPSDYMPICPKCGDLNPPHARVCETCSAYLRLDDARRDQITRLQASQAASRRRRKPVDNSVHNGVEENLLDTVAGGDVTSRDDTASGVGGAGVVEPLAADPDHPSRLVDR